MGFWSKLGKAALVAAPYVAAPFTGGASLALAPATASIAGAAAKGRAQGRQAEAGVNQSQDQLALERARLEQSGLDTSIMQDLAQRKYQQETRSLNQNRAIRGGLLQGAKDVSITGLPPGVTMGQISGGLRPSAITGKEQIGADMQREAMLALLNGETLPQIKQAPIPQLTPLPQSNGVDDVLDWTALIGSILGSTVGGGSGGGGGWNTYGAAPKPMSLNSFSNWSA